MSRTLSPALATALAGGVPLWRADLFDFTLIGGSVYRWTTWDSDLTASGHVYSSRFDVSTGNPFIKRTKWNLTNTMAVPSLDVTLLALNGGFAGGANIKTQIHNGLFDGASVLLSTAFMSTPGNTSALGVVPVFSGYVGGVTIEGGQAKITVKGKNNNLDQYAPRHVYQVGCNHAFCDSGCTLNRVTFTTAYNVGTGPTPSFVPWASSPSNPARYTSGTLTMTSGAASGQSRTIIQANASGLTLAYPLYELPAAGDSFTAFQGCDKSFNNAGSVQSCTAYANTNNYDGFPFVPPPGTAY